MTPDELAQKYIKLAKKYKNLAEKYIICQHDLAEEIKKNSFGRRPTRQQINQDNRNLLEEQIGNLEVQVSHLNFDIYNLRTQLDNCRNLYEQLILERNSVWDAKEIILTELDNINDSTIHLDNEYNKLSEEIIILTQSNQDLINLISACKQQIENKQASSFGIHDDMLQVMIVSLESQRDLLQNELNQLNESLRICNSKNNELNEYIHFLNDITKNANEEITSKKNYINLIKTHIKQQNEHISILRKNNMKYRQEYKRCQQELLN